MKAWRSTRLRFIVLLLGVFALLLPIGSRAASNDDQHEFRWDIVKNETVIDVIAGGVASALASDRSKITMTGTGTFEERGEDVSGGGTWKTFNSAGAPTGSGTYKVTALVTFSMAPGILQLPGGAMDFIGAPATARAGFAVLRIAYSDGSKGVLVFSCMLDGTPESVLEGITASKGFTDYWNSVIAPVTIFHVLH